MNQFTILFENLLPDNNLPVNHLHKLFTGSDKQVDEIVYDLYDLPLEERKEDRYDRN